MREIPPTFNGVAISNHLSAAPGRESQLGKTCSIRYRPTCLKKSHVFSLNARARFHPLSDNLSPPAVVPAAPFPLLFLPLSVVALVSPATHSLASLFHAARDAAFPDLFRLYGFFKAEIPPDCQSFIEATGFPAESRRPRLPSFDRLISHADYRWDITRQTKLTP